MCLMCKNLKQMVVIRIAARQQSFACKNTNYFQYESGFHNLKPTENIVLFFQLKLFASF